MDPTSSPIRLVHNTIPNEEIDQLIEWLKTYPKLTKGELTIEFEKQWSAWLGRKYSVFVNSGSSANYLLLAALKQQGILKDKCNVIVPALSWATTVAPVMQLGMTPVLCDVDMETLGLNTDHLQQLMDSYDIGAIMLVHVLGFPCDMDKIRSICKDIPIIEDSCETVGSKYKTAKAGTFGIASTFSTYFGHHFSTIEGGLISTDDENLYHTLLCMRSHGWARDLPDSKRKELEIRYYANEINEFEALYTFYEPGYNFRSTDLQAFLGINQLKTLNENNKIRYQNLLHYNELLENPNYKIHPNKFGFVSNFAYPIIFRCTEQRTEAYQKLKENNIDSRPLVAGNMGVQPFFVKRFGAVYPTYATTIHKCGMYVPNNPYMTRETVARVCGVLNPILGN